MPLYNDEGMLADGTKFGFKALDGSGVATGALTEVPVTELDPDQPEVGVVKLKKKLNSSSKWIDKAAGFIDAKKWKGQLKYKGDDDGIYDQLVTLRNSRAPKWWQILWPDAVADEDKSFIACKGFITILGVPPAKLSDEAPEELLLPIEIELFGEMEFSAIPEEEEP